MNGSSDQIIHGVTTSQIRVLLEILSDTAWRSHAFVEERYQERARNFAQTLTFLQRIGWVRTHGQQILPADRWIDRAAEHNDSVPGTVLLDAILDSPGEHQMLFANYLAQFRTADDRVFCPARGEFALADADVRDFLMGLGALRLDTKSKTHVLESAFHGAYVWALAQNGPITDAALIGQNEDRRQVGHNAELAVVVFERQRLGPRWASRVQHVSSERPFSPFDIKSVTVEDGRTTPRYIEVKAVSAADLEFNWSASEIEAARLLSLDYFLYLVPTHAANEFDLSRLRMIPDPFEEVYSRPSAWTKLPTNFRCRPTGV